MKKILLNQNLLVTLSSLLVSAISFLYNLVLARVFGLGSEIDAFLYATSIPFFLAAVFGSFFMYGSVPILNQHPNSNQSTSALFLVGCTIASIFMIISIIISINVDYNNLIFNDLTLANINIISIGWIIGGIQVVFGVISAIMNAKKYFILPFFLQLLTPIGATSGAIYSISSQNIIFPMIGMLIGLSIACVIGIIILRKNLIWLHLVTLKDLFHMLRGNAGSFNTILASCAFTTFALIDAQWAPQFGPGALSTLGYAQKIVIGFGNIIVIGIFMTSGVKFSESLLKDGYSNFAQLVGKSVLTVGTGSIVIAFGLWININYLIEIIFGSKIQTDDLQMLFDIIPLMLVGMIPMLCSSILLRAVLCLKNKHLYILSFGVGVPAVYTLLCNILNSHGFISIGFAYLFSWIFGISILLFCIFSKQKIVA